MRGVRRCPSGIDAARAAGVEIVIRIGPATVGYNVTMSVPDLEGVSFEGKWLAVADDRCR